MNYKVLALTVVTGLAFNSATTQAQEQDDSTTLGLFFGSENSIYVGGEDRTRVLPFFSGQWGDVYFRGASLGYNLASSERAKLSMSIELDGAFNDDRDDSSELADMESLDSVLLGSLNYQYMSDFGEFGASLSADVSGAHDGYEAKLSYSYPFRLGRWMMSPEISVNWMSEEVNTFYYGVSEADATAARPMYEAESGINYELGFSAIYPFSRHHSLMFRTAYTAYSDEITDSPIVDEDYAFSVGVGFLYRF